jgi:hypothetical protein
MAGNSNIRINVAQSNRELLSVCLVGLKKSMGNLSVVYVPNEIRIGNFQALNKLQILTFDIGKEKNELKKDPRKKFRSLLRRTLLPPSSG